MSVGEMSEMSHFRLNVSGYLNRNWIGNFVVFLFQNNPKGRAFSFSEIQEINDFKLLRTNTTEKTFPVYNSIIKKVVQERVLRSFYR